MEDTVKIKRADFEKAVEKAKYSEITLDIAESDYRHEWSYDEDKEILIRESYGYRYQTVVIKFGDVSYEFDYCDMFKYDDDNKEETIEYYEDPQNGYIQNENNVCIDVIDYDGELISNYGDYKGEYFDMLKSLLNPDF